MSSTLRQAKQVRKLAQKEGFQSTGNQLEPIDKRVLEAKLRSEQAIEASMRRKNNLSSLFQNIPQDSLGLDPSLNSLQFRSSGFMPGLESASRFYPNLGQSSIPGLTKNDLLRMSTLNPVLL